MPSYGDLLVLIESYFDLLLWYGDANITITNNEAILASNILHLSHFFKKRNQVTHTLLNGSRSKLFKK